ncbi:MAG: thiamine-phosphate kinase [Syntrophobacteraceae bacterium]
MMRVRDLGEFGVIDRISRLLPSASPDVVVGIGDDVAVLRCGTSEYLLATCDTQVENIHFRRGWITPYQLGRRVGAVNVSDIAAMGGYPSWGLVSLAFPDDLEVDFLDELYRGLRDQLDEVGCCVVGGNISRHPVDVIVDFTLLGRVEPDHLVLRKGGRPGDLVLVTGSLGDSRAGLELLSHPEVLVSGPCREEVLARHRTPQPRWKAGRVLGMSGRAHAMADVSDGLLADVRHLCRASGVTARIRAAAVPVGAGCLQVAAAFGVDPMRWALSGGEDYELLFFAAPRDAERLLQLLREEADTACTIIGEILEGRPEVEVILPDGEVRSGGSSDGFGWDHFGRREA